MIGSAFILHNGTWSCSNEVTLGIYSTPIFGDNNEITSIKEENTLTIIGLFNSNKIPEIGDKCEGVILAKNKCAIMGIVRSKSELQTVINVTNISNELDIISKILKRIKIEN